MGEHLRYIEDRCSAERMMEVTAAPRLYWNDCMLKAAYPALCSVSSKENSLCCWTVQSLDTRCECQPQDEEQLLWGWNGMAWVKILMHVCLWSSVVMVIACSGWYGKAGWAGLGQTRIWAELDRSGIYRTSTNSKWHHVHSSHLKQSITQ